MILARLFERRRRLLWVTLLPGKVGTANGCVELLQLALTILPPRHQVALVRADAGFFLTRFLTFLERQDLSYTIMAKFTPVLRWLTLHQLPGTAWRRMSPGIDMADAKVTLPSWVGWARRMVC